MMREKIKLSVGFTGSVLNTQKNGFETSIFSFSQGKVPPEIIKLFEDLGYNPKVNGANLTLLNFGKVENYSEEHIYKNLNKPSVVRFNLSKDFSEWLISAISKGEAFCYTPKRVPEFIALQLKELGYRYVFNDKGTVIVTGNLNSKEENTFSCLKTIPFYLSKIFGNVPNEFDILDTVVFDIDYMSKSLPKASHARGIFSMEIIKVIKFTQDYCLDACAFNGKLPEFVTKQLEMLDYPVSYNGSMTIVKVFNSDSKNYLKNHLKPFHASKRIS